MKMKWIMVVCGLLTCTMLQGVVAPQTVLQSMFGETLTGPAAEVVVRNWSLLIALVGGMLIYGAYRASARRLVLTVAIIGKFAFIVLVMLQGIQYVRSAALFISFDTAMILIFSVYLIGSKVFEQGQA